MKNEMKTYNIPVDWQVYGFKHIEARSLEEAINKIEIDSEKSFPIRHGNVESSLEVNYEMAQETYPDEEIGDEPFWANRNGPLVCPSCGGNLGKHFLNCSIFGG